MAIDRLKILSGDPICITDGLTLYQPTAADIRDFGEIGFWNTFHTICSAPWDLPSLLDDLGIDFMEITEWEFFRTMLPVLQKDASRLILGDFDFSEFEPMLRTNDEGEQDVVLYRDYDQMVFDEELYKVFIGYLREITCFQHTGKKAGNDATKKILIIEDRKERKRNAKKKDNDSLLFNMIVSLVNTEEFSYNYSTAFDLTIYQLSKSLTQIQGKKQAMAVLQGSMSGFCDTSNLSASDFSWIYSDEKYKPKAKKLVNNKSK